MEPTLLPPEKATPTNAIFIKIFSSAPRGRGAGGGGERRLPGKIGPLKTMLGRSCFPVVFHE